MKQDTKKRIEAYKDALPGLRERVIAVALMLAISVAMMASASYAWLTISRRPEVAGVTTNITANGNLEIALVSPDGVKPGESQVGDSAATNGQTIIGSNMTWGNLINLSDPAYGLDNIVLRPALLSGATNLLDQPLKGADYGDDGRVELYYNENFQFVNWVEPANGLDGYFTFYNRPQYGVRAISTVKYEYKNNAYYQFTVLMGHATRLHSAVGDSYQKMIGNDTYINALASLMGTFMTDKLNGSNTNVKNQIAPMYNLMVEFDQIMEDYQDVLVALANVQVYNKYGPAEYAAHTYTWETLAEADAASLKKNGVSLTSLTEFRSVSNTVDQILYGEDATEDDCIQDLYNRTANDASAQVLMSELTPYIDSMVKIASCQIILDDGTTYTVGALGKSAATNLLGKDVDAKITEGALKKFEQLTGYRMQAKNVEVKATYLITVTMKAKTIMTDAKDPYTHDSDLVAIQTVANNNKGDYTAVAEDTFGIAIDFWVRTNASNEFLILEGNVLTETKTVRAVGVDRDGNEVELYTVTITSQYVDEEENQQTATESIAVYKVTEKDANGNDVEVWRKAINHSLLYNEDGTAPEGQTISNPVERYEETVTVIGYEGENRVWTENQQMDVNSTTQGSGSCYIFYADDPTQQANCLRLLSNLRVAFIDSNEDSATYGKMIGLAKLDIENRYEENGKVILPLVLIDDGSGYLTKIMGDLAIMPLVKNEATRLTAIVYLDGRNMSNADVLAANDIQGQLNIQFGTTQPLNAQENEKLENATRSVSVVASANDQFPGINTNPISFKYDEADRFTVNVRMLVEGEQPQRATAFFMRRVNDNQGSREQSFELTQGTDGYWYGSFTFTAPGEYVLRTVQLDGIDYNLPADDYPQVIIEGFTVESVSMYQNGNLINGAATVMTDSRSLTASLSLEMGSDKKMPKTVRLVFVKEDNTQVTANMTLGNGGIWNGTATFTSSGVYTLRYVVMDGEYTELNSQFQHKLTVFAGMKVRIRDTGDYNLMTWEGEPVTAPVYVEIVDDTGEEMRYLSGVKLYYALNGSVNAGMNTDLKWDDTEDCYLGNLLISSPGIFTFYSVDIGTSILKNTDGTVPSYTIISPDPPEYVGPAAFMEDMDYILSVSNGTIYVGVEIAHADAATVTAILYNAETGKEHKVTGVRQVSTDEFLFALHSDTNGDNPKYQAGDWTIIGLELINVYTGSGENVTLHGKDNPLVWDLTAGSDFWGNKQPDDLHVKVVTPRVTLSGTDENLDGGAFMGSATAQNSIVVTITDHNGNPLDTKYVTITNPIITYKYTENSSSTYGGYTSGFDVEDITLTGQSTDGKTYTMSKITLSYAGEYLAKELTFSLTVGVNKVDYTYLSEELKGENLLKLPVLEDMPRYTLTTARPTVTVTGITPKEGSTNRHYNTTAPSKLEQLVTGSFFSMDEYNAVVYLYFKYAADYGDYDQEAFDALIPQVQLTLSGMPEDFTNATATFGSVEYQFTSDDLSLWKEIGSATDGAYSYTIFSPHTYPKLSPAGTHSIDQITVVYNSVTYTVKLTHSVTISQPDAPIYLDYSVFGYGFNGSAPDMDISPDGGAITVTLPSVDKWVSRQTEYSYSDPTEVVTESTVSYLTSSKKGIILTTYYYDLYTRTKTSITASTTTTVFDGTYAVIGWKIGDTIYAPGDTVTISSGQTATAIIEEVVSERVVISTNTAVQTTVTLVDKYSSNTSGYSKRSDAVTTLYTADKYPDGYTYVESP